jgi:hypothetical protein
MLWCKLFATSYIVYLRDCGFKMVNQEMLEAWSVTLLPPHAFSCAANHAKVAKSGQQNASLTTNLLAHSNFWLLTIW